MANIFSLVGDIFIDNSKADESIQKTKSNAEKLGEKFSEGAKTAGKWAVGIATGATAVATALFKTAQSASADLDKVQKGAQELGMSYEAYQELDYALNRSGASINDLSKGFVNITKDLNNFKNGVKGASDTYDKLGVSLKNADGTMKSSEDILKESLTTLASMSDETERNALANELFGKSYTNLIPLLNSGADGIEDLISNAHELGLVMSDDAVDAGAQFGDMLADVQDSFGKVIQTIGVKLFPLIEEVLQWILDHMPEIQGFLQQFFDFLTKAIEVLVDVIKAIAPVVEELWNKLIKPILEGVLDFISGVFTGDIEKSFKGISKIIESVWEGLKAIFKRPLDWLVNTLNGWVSTATKPFKDLANAIGSIWESIKSKFKLPHFTVSGSLNPAKWFTQGMPKIGVEWYAKGGILNDPTLFGFNPYSGNAMVGGEAGAEAIAPIETLEEYFKKWSNNDELLNRVDALIGTVESYMTVLVDNSQKQIVLDNGALVGNLMPDINKGLNKITNLERRGVR